VNSPIYGGSGDGIAVASNAKSYGLSSAKDPWWDVVIHELGHSIFGLADEYDYYMSPYSQEPSQNNHPSVEPYQPNVTIYTTRAAIKWSNLIRPETPIPTTKNRDCTRCDDQPNPCPEGTVGAF
jgi:IgA Peptidase M64